MAVPSGKFEWYGPVLTVVTALIGAFVALLTYIFKQEKDSLHNKADSASKEARDLAKEKNGDLKEIRDEIKAGDAEAVRISQRASDELWCAVAELRKGQNDNATVLARIDERTLSMSNRLTSLSTAMMQHPEFSRLIVKDNQ